MSDRIGLKVSKDEFMKKSQKEQNWMLFTSLSSMDTEGCRWGKRKYSQSISNKLTYVGVGFAASVPVLAALGKILGFW